MNKQKEIKFCYVCGHNRNLHGNNPFLENNLKECSVPSCNCKNFVLEGIKNG